MKNHNKTNRPIPPADIILHLLNGNDKTEDEFLEFYDSYIKAAANGIDFPLNEDLMQDIRLAVIKSLPVLRNAVLKRFFESDAVHHPVVVIIPTDNSFFNSDSDDFN